MPKQSRSGWPTAQLQHRRCAAKFPISIAVILTILLHAQTPADWQYLLILGDGEHLIPILDPLFVNELEVNDGKMNIGYSNMWIRGLKDLDLESIR